MINRAMPKQMETKMAKEKDQAAKDAKAKQVQDIRAMRSEPNPEDPSKPKFTHKQVAEHFGVMPGFVSNVARNRIYTDPNYTPVFDGHRDLGPRQPKPSAVPGEVASGEQAPATQDGASGEQTPAISTGEDRGEAAE